MSAKTNPASLHVGVDILNAERDEETKVVLLQTGDVVGAAEGGGGTVDGERVEHWQHVGLVSIPPKPEAGKSACQGIVVRRSNHDACIATRDLRGQELAGQLKYGETCIYAAGETGTAQGRVILKQNGSINLYTRAGNTEGGAGMGVFVDPENDQISILNSKGYGIVINGDGVFLSAGGAIGLKLESSGDVSLVATGKCQIDGGGICLGSTAVPGLNSALVGVTGIAGVASTKVLIALV